MVFFKSVVITAAGFRAGLRKGIELAKATPHTSTVTATLEGLLEMPLALVPWPKGQEPPGWPRPQTPCAPEPCTTTQLQKENEGLEKRLLQTIDERDECEQQFSQAYFLATGNSPEWSNNFGHDHAARGIEEVVNLLKEHARQLQSQLATIRESAPREAIAIVKNQRAGMDSNGLCSAQERIESLITTPASECEWVINEDGTYETSCLKMFTFTHGTPAENKFSHCPYCGKHIAQSNEVAKPLTGNAALDAAAAAAWRERNG